MVHERHGRFSFRDRPHGLQTRATQMHLSTSLLAFSDSDLSAALFYLFAGTAAVSAFGLVLSRNIVRSAVCLLFTLAGVAGLYFLLNAEFLAAVQLVVYAGGTLILIIFGVMLTSKSPFSRYEPKMAEVVVATSIAAILLIALVLAIRTTFPAGSVADLGPPAGTELYPMARL